MQIKAWLRRCLKGLAIIGLGVVVLGLNIYFAPAWWGLKAYLVPTDSMTPTLIPGDMVLVNLKAYVGESPQVGDIVVFADSDKANGRTLIKRVVRLGATCLEKTQCSPEEVSAVYVQGDNPAHSYDSRNFGAVASSHLIGKAFFILVTLNTSGTLHFKRAGWL